MQARAGNPQSTPALLIIVGAVITAVSTFLQWFELSVSGDTSQNSEYKGNDLETIGYGLLAFGIVLLILGAILWTKGAQGGGRGLAIASLVLSIFVLAAGLFSVIRPANSLGQYGEEELTAEYGFPTDMDIGEALQNAQDDGSIDVTPGIGAYLALLGGLLALGGSILGMKKAKTAGRDQDLQTGPPPGTGTDVGTGGPGATGPGTPPAGGATPADPTGTTAPPHGTPPGGPNPPRP